MTTTKVTKSDRKTPKRELWGGRIEFFLAALGYSVGMGTLTRFPYMAAKNGGGAFLIAFIVAMAFVGIPLFYLELILGQFSGRSPLSVWVISPAFKGIGYAMTVLTLFATSYYMPFTWSVVYLIASMGEDVPWRGCHNPWNTPNCAERVIWDQNFTNSSSTLSLTPTTTLSALKNATFRVSSPAEEYWNEFVLEITRDGITNLGSLKWNLVLAHLSTYVMVFLCVIRGTASVGKVVYVTATLPYVLLTILFIRGVTLEGSLTGVKYFLETDWARLGDHNVWLEATIQVVFQLGPAWGSLISMSRCNDFKHKCYREAIVVPIGNLLTALYGGFAIFSTMGYMSEKYHVPIESVASSGPALVFVVYPEVLAQLPVAPFWAIIFFLMLISVAVDSQFAFFETIVGGIVDILPSLSRWKMLVSATVAICLFLLGLPLCTQGGMYIYQILDWYGGVLTFTLIAFLESIVIAYIYGLRRFFNDAKLMFGSPPNYLFGFAWFFVTPICTAIVAFVGLWNLSTPVYAYTNFKYPDWAIGMGWCIAVASFLPVPIFMVYTLFKYRGNLRKCFQPTEEWLPVKEDEIEAYRNRWYRNRSNSNIRTSNRNQSATFDDDPFCDFFIWRNRRDQLFKNRTAQQQQQKTSVYYEEHNAFGQPVKIEAISDNNVIMSTAL